MVKALGSYKMERVGVRVRIARCGESVSVVWGYREDGSHSVAPTLFCYADDEINDSLRICKLLCVVGDRMIGCLLI